MSHFAPRTTPLWSAAGHVAGSPLSIAGLPSSTAWVKVGPPLSASVPSTGSLSTRSPLPVNAQLCALSRLCPPDLTGPTQFVPPPATIALRRVMFCDAPVHDG